MRIVNLSRVILGKHHITKKSLTSAFIDVMSTDSRYLLPFALAASSRLPACIGQGVYERNSWSSICVQHVINTFMICGLFVGICLFLLQLLQLR